MITSSKEAVHGALEMVHLKVFAPTPSEVIVLVGLEDVVIVPAPLMSVQTPVPVIAVFPASVALVPQTD